MYCHMITAAKEEMLSTFAPWCAETCISASAGENQKPHQGFAGQNLILRQGMEWSKSTLALGLLEWSGKTASGPAVAANNGQQNPQQPKPVKPCTADAMANSVQHAQQTFMNTFGQTEGWALGLAVTFGCKGGPWGCALGVETFLVNQPAILTTAAIKGSYSAYKEAFTNPTHACE